MSALWSDGVQAIAVCPLALRPAVEERVGRIGEWTPWKKDFFPTNPFVVMAPDWKADVPSPDGWCWLGEWEPGGELYALRLHYPDGDTAWVLWSGPDEHGQPQLVALGNVFL